MDSVQLSQFLSDKFIAGDAVCEGILSVLTADIRKEIWAKIDSDHAFAQAFQVNLRWREEILAAWKEFCRARNFFVDADFFASQGRDWIWILKCKTVQFKEGQSRMVPLDWKTKEESMKGNLSMIRRKDSERRSTQTRAFTLESGSWT